MGILRQSPDGRRVALAARTLVGRSLGCELRIVDPQVSGEHAVLLWEGDAWTVRDLGSRNGTWVNGERLEPGGRRPLRKSDTVVFAVDAHTWVLVDAGPATVQAACVDDDRLVTGSADLLALPDDDHVELTLSRAADGRWRVEATDGAVRFVADGDVVEAGGARWRLHLPAVLPPTVASDRIANLALGFRVSPDEEHVDVTLSTGAVERPLRPRSHHYLLLTLARERLADAERATPARAEGERGWVTEERLASMLRLDRQTVKVQIHRARQELAAHGVPDAAGIVERRAGTGQLRIGVARLSVKVG